jgi:alpha-ribazole phosphatase/probable phosphoglycerate mutase
VFLFKVVVMKIWVTRHGQTDLNKDRRMQGRSDVPLNETGRRQAEEARARIGDIVFDAVYASPLDRAIETGSIIGHVPREKIIIDRRLIEADFGRYEGKKYYFLGPAMTLYWSMPWVFPRPSSVESLASLKERSSSFLKELEQKDYENVLIACHGGIMRALCGYLNDDPRGIQWYPKPRNCEIRVYASDHGRHELIRIYKKEKK